MKIVIDPGHGGSDPGVLDASTGNSEKYAALVTSLTLKHFLHLFGHDVELTRVTDVRPSFGERTRPRGAQLLVSVHYDWHKGRSLVYYPAERSRPRDKALAEHLAETLRIPAWPSTRSQHGRLAVLDDYTEGLAILWEVDRLADWTPDRSYRVGKCREFIAALHAALQAL